MTNESMMPNVKIEIIEIRKKKMGEYSLRNNKIFSQTIKIGQKS